MTDALTSKTSAAKVKALAKWIRSGEACRAFEIEAADVLLAYAALLEQPQEATGECTCGAVKEWHKIHDARCPASAAYRGAPVEPQGWQPIETAPHMRKIIVHYLNALGKSRTVMACYYEKNSLEMHDDYEDVGTYDDATGMTWADEGWYEEHDSDNPIMALAGTPTHWQPLPSAPVTKEKAL